jgi:two-component system, cell cycle sensor histidine kinase and response regulator CckA
LSRRILVVEDDPDLRESLADVLEAKGHDVTTAVDGREALDTMRRVRPDVVILDLMMPVMDGWAFRVEQRRDPLLADTPIVALSASESSSAAAVDADAYLRKPIDLQRLDRAIEDVLVARERQREPARQAQTERLAALGTLAAGVAHEINNPLTYVLINLERARRLLAQLPPEPQVAELRSMLVDALEGVERIRGVTRSIRDFSRVEEEPGVQLQPAEVLDSALRLVASDIAQRARLIRDLQPTAPVIGAVGRLGQVFLNLLMNAIQALPADRPAAGNEIRAATRTEGDRVIIEVTDTGEGIPEHHLGRVFEPFFSTKPVGSGGGLGLSISHGIVRNMGGEIQVESEVGRGTTVRVVLPAARAVEAPARSAATSSPRRRVLVVDDEPSLLEALDRALGDHHEVIRARGGREALDKLRRDRGFDAVLCDLHMPDVSGRDVHSFLAGADPGLASRVVFMTGGTFTEEMRQFMTSVANPVLEKPIDLDRLEGLLAERQSSA